MSFGESAKTWVAEALFFVTETTPNFCHFPWIDFRQTFHEHMFRWWLATNGFTFQKSFHYGVEFPEKNVFLRYKRYPVCAQATGYGKRSATPTLFPSLVDM